MRAARADDPIDVPDELEPEDAFGHHATTGPVSTVVPADDLEPDDHDIDV
ncbi:hypothetical protein [Curtobacterium sp. Leaf261]|nr:hypothetical protein [Curtobacterium sp. Leaf261]